VVIGAVGLDSLKEKIGVCALRQGDVLSGAFKRVFHLEPQKAGESRRPFLFEQFFAAAQFIAHPQKQKLREPRISGKPRRNSFR